MTAPVLRPNPLDQALRYLSMGFSIIPLKARDKKPAISSWKPYQERRATVDEVQGWFGAGVDLNIGIVTGAVSGLVALDGDSIDAVNWMQTHHPTPMRTRTGGGKHAFFRHPGTVVKNNVKLGAMALDVRGDGGYVVAPGSIHPSGSLYEEEGTWGPAATLPMFQPAWLGQKVTPLVPAPAVENRITKYLDAAPGAVEGQGGDAATFRMACKLVRGFNLSDAEALTYLLAWNAKCLPPWTEADLRIKVESARANGTEPFGYLLEAERAVPQSVEEGGSGSVREHLRLNDKGQIRKTPGNLAKILRLDAAWGDQLALNEMSREVLFRGKVVQDSFVDTIQEQVEDQYGVAFGRDEVAAKVLAQASKHTIHPVRDWLKGLTWDREERIPRLAKEVLGTDEPMATHYLRCTLVGAVRRVMHPGTKMDTLPVFQGVQGMGKSTFWKVLVGPQWFSDSPLDLESKDGFMVLHRKWCTEIAELDHMTSAKAAERIKAFLSSSEDVFRPPYGKSVGVFPRSCFIVGTVNPDAFLMDATGSRRFWPIACHSVDLDLLATWREQLWAEAMDLHLAGIPHWLDTTQETLRIDQAHQFQVADPWVEQVDIALAGLQRAGRLFSVDGVSAAELMNQIGVPAAQQTRAASMKMSAVLKSLGWKSVLTGARRLSRWFPPPE